MKDKVIRIYIEDKEICFSCRNVSIDEIKACKIDFNKENKKEKFESIVYHDKAIEKALKDAYSRT